MVSESIFRFETFDPERAVTSFLYGPKILLATRVIGSIYTIAVLVGALMTTESLVYFMKYFTHITYIALSIYYVWSMIWSILYVRLPPSERHLFIKQRNRGESNIYWVIYQTLAVYHVVVPLVYWIILQDYQKERTGLYEWASISQHTTDGILMLIEVISTRTLMDIRHVFFAVLFMALYLGMAWVAYLAEGVWVYPFLDFKLHNWTVVGLGYGGVAVGVVILYCLLWKVHDLKEFLGTRKERNGFMIGVVAEEKEEAPLVSDAWLPAHVPRITA